MQHTYIVLKPISGPAGLIPVGSEVEAGAWRNLDKLLEQRCLRPKLAEGAAELSDSDLRAIVEQQSAEIAALKAALQGLSTLTRSRRAKQQAKQAAEGA